ncbi:hypothetical protein TSUD_200320 [Trifolium subterraneum]|nr:hypothetical protein TSUD_200320 [Trifolium subterraneum]
MAFQDFDLITERRKSEKRAQLKKRILIGVVSLVVLAGVIGCAFFVATSKGAFGGSSTKESSPSSKGGSKQQHVAHSERIVKLVCSSADYKEKCEGPLNKAMEKDPKLQHPKDLLKAYINVVEDEVNKAFDKTNTFKFETEEEKGAFEDCKKLFGDAKDDLQTSIDQLTETEFKKLSTKTPDLNSWLSAVISFQQTCVDGFPEGKLKTNLQKLFEDSKEFVSNSLAMVTQVSTFLSTVQTLARGRIPSWIHADERRVLKAADIRPTPNVTVAKDGSEGVYDEQVTVSKKMQNVTMYGEGSQKSIITGSKNFRDGVRTFQTASFGKSKTN